MAVSLSAFSTKDLEAILEGKLDKVSTPGLRLLAGDEYGLGETIGRSFERGFTSTFRGVGDLLGVTPSAEAPAEPREGDPLMPWMDERTSVSMTGEKIKTDFEKEQEFRAMAEQRPVAAYGSNIVGSIIGDPTNLIPLGAAKTVGKTAAQFAGVGGVTAGIEPVYEEFGDSRLYNIAGGLVIGGVLGAGVGKLTQVLERRAVKDADAQVEPDTSGLSKTREEIEAELPPIEPTQTQLPSLLAKAPEADQRYVEDILSRYEEGQEIPKSVALEMAEEVQDKELAAVFRNVGKPRPIDYWKPEGGDLAGVSKSADEFVPENKLPEVTAKVEPDLGPSKSTDDLNSVLERADRTGDYRDYLTKSSVRTANLSRSQFEKILNPANPFAKTNYKVLISKRDDIKQYMQRVNDAIQGRIKYERGTGTTWQEMIADSEDIPEEVVLQAILGRRKEEILPAPVLIKGVQLAAKAIKDIENLTELYEAAKRMNSDEAYTLLHNELQQALAIISSLEGNRSQVGRVFNSFKMQQQLLDNNQMLRGFTGGIGC